MSEGSNSFVLSEDEMPSVKAVPKSGPMTRHEEIEDEVPDLGEFSSDEDRLNQSANEMLIIPAGQLETEPFYFQEVSRSEAVSPGPEIEINTSRLSWKSPKSSKMPKSIPVVNASTVNPNTYDLDRLMDPKVQKKAETKDRFSAAHGGCYSKPKRAADEPDYIKLNKERAGHPRTSHSHEEPKRLLSPPDPINVEDRFYKYKKAVDEKIRKMEEEQVKKERESCTFSPDILEKRGINENPRSADVFFQEMMLHKQQIANKLTALREKSRLAEEQAFQSLFHPQLNEKSKLLTASRSANSIPTYEKLFQAHREQMQKQLKTAEQEQEGSDVSETTQDSVKPFTPAINKTSLMILREKPIEDMLMEDAKRRQQKLQEVPTSPKPKVQPSVSSVQLLTKKFKSELSTAYAVVADQSSMISYTKMVEVLKMMHFVDSETGDVEHEGERVLISKMWNIMKLPDEGTISKANLETFLLAVMNYPVSETRPSDVFKDDLSLRRVRSNPQLDDPRASDLSSNKKSVESQTAIGRVEDGVFRLGPGDAKKIHMQFLLWFENRTAVVNRSNKNPTYKDAVVYSHQPEVNKKSKLLTDARLSKIASQGFTSHHHYLLAELGMRNARQADLQSKHEKETLKECTFSPELIKRYGKQAFQDGCMPSKGVAGDYWKMMRDETDPQKKTEMLFNLASSVQMRKKMAVRTDDEREMESNALSCTFSPNTAKTQHYASEHYRVPYNPPRGVTKAVERIVKGRRIYERNKARRATGLPNRGRAMELDELPDEPMAVLAVQVNGRAEELRVRPGENIEHLIWAFTAQHKLNPDDCILVSEQLKSQYLLLSDPSA